MTYKNIIKHAIVRTAIGLTALLGGCDKDNDIPDVPIPTIPAEPIESLKVIGPIPPKTSKKLPIKDNCEALDVMIMFDNTSSMGPYINQAKQKGMEALNTIRSTYPDSRIAISTVADFGHGDIPYELKTGFTTDTSIVGQAINSIKLCGGGDDPEAYSHAIQKASKEKWRPDAYRLVILVADSVAHDKNKLKANVKNSNETLAVLTANEVNISYWKSVTPFTLPLASHKNLNSLLLRSIMISCGDYPKIEYDTAKWDLDSEDKKELDGLVKMLKNKKNIGIQVDGHTDSVGANFRNDILGIRRAKGVAAYLNSKGIKTAAASYGEVKPLCTTETEDCKQLNRRSHLYPVLLSPKSSKFPSKMGNFYLAKIDGDTATYSFIPTSSKHFGSVIGNMFNKKDQANVFHTVGHRNISLDADGNNSAGDHIRKFEPVYLKARSN